ncbi:A24 family peptidase [Vibrio parahaemolyticus]|uniref:A24 family peptidase n=1 Tax=Vibrio mediterranei TaxID=689 RepID=UPI0040681C7C
MLVAIWTLLVILAVYDLRENRIPNKILLLLLLVVFLSLNAKYGGTTSIPTAHFWGLVVGFAIGFLLYLIGAMSAGDVKLITILCCLVSLENVGEFYVYIILVGAAISILYMLLAVARSREKVRALARSYLVANIYGRLQRSSAVKPIIFQVPFAPAIVLAYLAVI